MEKYIDDDSLNDPFLQRMLLKLPIEKTSDNFTNQVMGQIYARVEPEIEPQVYRKQMLLAYLSIGVGIVVIGVILFALWPFLEIKFNLGSIQIINFINATLSMADVVTDFMGYLKESTVLLSIFFSIFILFLVERLLRRGVPGNSTFIL